MFNRKQSTISETYYRYETIPLKLYLEIIESREVIKILISGRLNIDKCAGLWEEIVRKNNEANGSFEFDIYFNHVQVYGLIWGEYIFLKTSILKLLMSGRQEDGNIIIPIDKELISVLAKKGYRISLDDSNKYAETLYACLRRVENLVTKMNSKGSEIAQMAKDDSKKGNKASFDAIMANLIYHWPGAKIDDDLTLSRYNEYMKLIKQKYKNNGRPQ